MQVKALFEVLLFIEFSLKTIGKKVPISIVTIVLLHDINGNDTIQNVVRAT